MGVLGLESILCIFQVIVDYLVLELFTLFEQSVDCQDIVAALPVDLRYLHQVERVFILSVV